MMMFFLPYALLCAQGKIIKKLSVAYELIMEFQNFTPRLFRFTGDDVEERV
jgi:hypothetical protein